jgi:hypothetical protein
MILSIHDRVRLLPAVCLRFWIRNGRQGAGRRSQKLLLSSDFDMTLSPKPASPVSITPSWEPRDLVSSAGNTFHNAAFSAELDPRHGSQHTLSAQVPIHSDAGISIADSGNLLAQPQASIHPGIPTSPAAIDSPPSNPLGACSPVALSPPGADFEELIPCAEAGSGQLAETTGSGSHCIVLPSTPQLPPSPYSCGTRTNASPDMDSGEIADNEADSGPLTCNVALPKAAEPGASMHEKPWPVQCPHPPPQHASSQLTNSLDAVGATVSGAGQHRGCLPTCADPLAEHTPSQAISSSNAKDESAGHTVSCWSRAGTADKAVSRTVYNNNCCGIEECQLHNPHIVGDGARAAQDTSGLLAAPLNNSVPVVRAPMAMSSAQEALDFQPHSADASAGHTGERGGAPNDNGASEMQLDVQPSLERAYSSTMASTMLLGCGPPSVAFGRLPSTLVSDSSSLIAGMVPAESSAVGLQNIQEASKELLTPPHSGSPEPTGSLPFASAPSACTAAAAQEDSSEAANGVLSSRSSVLNSCGEEAEAGGASSVPPPVHQMWGGIAEAYARGSLEPPQSDLSVDQELCANDLDFNLAALDGCAKARRLVGASPLANDSSPDVSRSLDTNGHALCSAPQWLHPEVAVATAASPLASFGKQEMGLQGGNTWNCRSKQGLRFRIDGDMGMVGCVRALFVASKDPHATVGEPMITVLQQHGVLENLPSGQKAVGKLRVPGFSIPGASESTIAAVAGMAS